MSAKVMKERVGDHFVSVLTTVHVESVHVDFNEILESVVVEPDECYNETPWDMCDGYDHEAVPTRNLDVRVDAARGYCWHDGNRERVVITLDDHVDADLYDWYREQGASKQVAREMVALSMRKRIDQLKDWYENGWHWWWVHGEYRSYEDSVGGVDDYDYAVDSVREEIALNIAAALEDDDYIVTNKPEVPNENPGRLARLKHNRTLFSWID
jgi:hypothetical protein